MATSPTSEVLRHLCDVVLLRDGAALTDGQLLESFVGRRDQAALAALVRRHGPMVWGVCRRVLGHHDAEDAFQATFLVLVKKADSVRPREMVANWLHGVARQTALKARATAARRRARETPLAPTTEPAAPAHDPRPELRAVLDLELARLPDRYRAAIVLCDLEGRTRREAARQLGLPEGTVASRLMRGRALLARRLARHGLPLSAAALAPVCVPAAVQASTIRAATVFAAGPAPAAGLIAPGAAALADGRRTTMLPAKLKTATLLTGTLVILALGLGLCAYHGVAQPPPPRVDRQPPARDAGKPGDQKPAPRYCWLDFGPKANVRALLRLDGEAISIDRDGD